VSVQTVPVAMAAPISSGACETNCLCPQNLAC